MRKCSAGLDIQTKLTSCEYQLFYSRFCQFQKCMNRLVDLQQACFSEAGLDKQNSSAVIVLVNVCLCVFVCVRVWHVHIIHQNPQIILDNFHQCFTVCHLLLYSSLCTQILDNTVPLHSKLFCGWDREREDFCGVMFPELITLEPVSK